MKSYDRGRYFCPITQPKRPRTVLDLLMSEFGIKKNDPRKSCFKYSCDVSIVDFFECRIVKLTKSQAAELGLQGDMVNWKLIVPVREDAGIFDESVYIERYYENGMTLAYSNNVRALFNLVGDSFYDHELC